MANLIDILANVKHRVFEVGDIVRHAHNEDGKTYEISDLYKDDDHNNRMKLKGQSCAFRCTYWSKVKNV